MPEAMRAESMRSTPHGCLSRETAGIRGGTLIINLPGSKKASTENFAAVCKPIRHGVEMLRSAGSADCAATEKKTKKEKPSVDDWLREIKAQPDAGQIGMYLIHTGVVRATARSKVRAGDDSARPVTGMSFSYDGEKAKEAIADARKMDGIYAVKVWVNEGELKVGDDIMQVLIGADIRPHAVQCLEALVGRIKNQCVTEKELYAEA
jgi:molybdopterin synthase catalytic subunit